MNDREGFISRWARRKRETATVENRPRERTEVSTVEADAPHIEGKAENAMREDAEAPGAAPGELTVDLSKLPSIESITAETDIRQFLGRGVPSALRQAALRKMWVADPSIRDFIGIAENQWDFNAQGSILGFDLSPPVGDLKRMAAEILAGPSREVPQTPGQIATGEPASAPVGDASGGGAPASQQSAISEQPSATNTDQVHIDSVSQDDTAMQHSADPGPRRRSHGGAMPI